MQLVSRPLPLWTRDNSSSSTGSTGSTVSGSGSSSSGSSINGSSSSSSSTSTISISPSSRDTGSLTFPVCPCWHIALAKKSTPLALTKLAFLFLL